MTTVPALAIFSVVSPRKLFSFYMEEKHLKLPKDSPRILKTKSLPMMSKISKYSKFRIGYSETCLFPMITIKSFQGDINNTSAESYPLVDTWPGFPYLVLIVKIHSRVNMFRFVNRLLP